MSYEAVPDGELAAVVTYLEMLQPPATEVPPSTLQLRHVASPASGLYQWL